MSTSFRRTGGMMNRGGKPSGDLPPRQNVAIVIDQYVLADKRKSTPDQDVVEGFLIHDVPEWGLKAEYSVPTPGTDEQPQPITRVRVQMPLPRGVETSRRRDIWGLSKPKGAGPAMDPGSVVVFEKAWFDRKDGSVKAHYAHGAASRAAREQGLKTVFSDVLVCVRPEDHINSGERKGPAGRVDVLISDPRLAVAIGSMDDLKAQVAGLIETSSIGNPGFQLLARQHAPEGSTPEQAEAFARDPNTRLGGYSIGRRKKVGEGDDAQWVPETADGLMARFAKENPDFEQLIGNPEWQIEFVPMMAVNQAASLVPSKAQPGERVRDNSPIYGIYGEVPEGRDGEHARLVVTGADGKKFGMIDCGWMPSHVVCERKDVESDIWYSTYQNGMGARMDVDSIHDVRTPATETTPGTPSYHLVAIQAEAARNVEGKKAYRAARPENDGPDADAPEAGAPAPGR